MQLPCPHCGCEIDVVVTSGGGSYVSGGGGAGHAVAMGGGAGGVSTAAHFNGEDRLEYIRSYYSVPAQIGGRVRFDGNPGTIVGVVDHYLLVRLDQPPDTNRDPHPERPVVLHPTWKVEYLDA